MKTLLAYLFLLLGIGGFQKISDINEHLAQAESNFKKKQYAEAVRNYEFLVYKQNQQKPQLLLNLAHAYLQNQEPEKAQKLYTRCSKTENPYIRSVAWEMLGTIQTKLPDYKQALTFYKRALVANPENEQARYNYELLKKYLRQNPEKQNQLPPPAPEKKEKQDEKKPQQEEQKETSPQSAEPDANGNQESDSKDQQEKGEQEQKPEKQTDPEGNKPPQQEKPNGENGREKEQKSGEEKGNEEGQNLAENEEKLAPPKANNKPGKETATGDEKRLQTQYERLRKANISPEKANMMLEAMRAAEQQYLQQIPKKGTKQPDKNKPNW